MNFSRYAVVNTFKEIEILDLELDLELDDWMYKGAECAGSLFQHLFIHRLVFTPNLGWFSYTKVQGTGNAWLKNILQNQNQFPSFMDHSPTESNSHSSSPEIPCLICNLKVLCCVHKNCPLDHILSR
jgi:hypothetical protein